MRNRRARQLIGAVVVVAVTTTAVACTGDPPRGGQATNQGTYNWPSLDAPVTTMQSYDPSFDPATVTRASPPAGSSTSPKPSTSSKSGPVTVSSSVSTGSTESSQPTGSTTKSGGQTPGSAVTPGSTRSSTSESLSAQEAADREQIEQAWLNWWKVFLELPTTPDGDWRAKAESVATEPLVTKMVEGATESNAKGTENFGTVGHRFHWTAPIDGTDIAMVRDCMDQTKFGVRNRKTKAVDGYGDAQREAQVVAKKVAGKWLIEQWSKASEGQC